MKDHGSRRSAATGPSSRRTNHTASGFDIVCVGTHYDLTLCLDRVLRENQRDPQEEKRARAEPIRLLLADQGASWTDDEVQMADWFSGKSEIKKTAAFGQLPKFQHGDFVLYQSNSILRYLGRVYGISGSNNQESALIDMVNDGVEDLRQKYSRLIFFEYETGKEKYIKDLPNQLSAFEKILSNNSNGTKFVVGDKISYTDYNLLDILHCHIDLDPKCLTSFPLLSAYVERIASRPKLSQYLKSEKRNKRPITPKHK